MIPLKLVPRAGAALEVLCLGSHSDDIEIGCGGSLLRLAEEYPDCVFHWVVFSASGDRADEARQAASLLVDRSRLQGPTLLAFQDGFMPFAGAEIKTAFERLKQSISPDVIFTHYGKDAHQDHRLISELTWNTFRDHLILEYEIPKYDGDLGQPGCFLPLRLAHCEKKVDVLMSVFGSQRSKRWFQRETFFSLMRLRGMECNAPSGYAEAFHVRKMIL